MSVSIETHSDAERNQPLLEVRHLEVQYTTRRSMWPGKPVVFKALQDITFHLEKNETLGIIGESGCGKSTLLRTLVGLQKPTAGAGRLADIALFSQRRPIQRLLRRRVQMVFQDPFGSLNPRRSVGAAIRSALRHGAIAREAHERELELLLEQVGLRSSHANDFPHELSGGQRQRVAIARALAPRPDLLVLDEPTSALDVSIQAQVVNLLQDLKTTRHLSYLLVTHDLGLVRQMADRIVVMYRGTIVETGPTEHVLSSSVHPYTRTLLAASAYPEFGARATHARGSAVNQAAEK
jgi:ABC-type oligopeptide transport system ATPase subunit